MFEYYKAGLNIPVPIKGDRGPLSFWFQGIHPERYEVGAWIATPGFLQSQIDRLWNEILQVGREIEGKWRSLNCTPGMKEGVCGKLNSFINKIWSPFVFEYEKFKLDHQFWYQRLWGGLYDEIQAYRKKLIKLYEAAQGIGVEFQSPKPAPPEKSAFSELGDFIKTLGLMLLVGFAIWAGVQVFGGAFKAAPAATATVG